MENHPKISIITPCLNRAEFVAQAVESVLEQDYPHVEHIVVDGVSTDGSLDILRRYDHIKLSSEPDKGLYYAINKGISLTQGDIIGFLNTDDHYEPNILKNVVQNFSDNPNIDALVGNAILYKEDIPGNRDIIELFIPKQPDKMLLQVTKGTPMINAWFFRKNIFDRYGVFDTQYRFAADREFLIRLALNNLKYLCLPTLLYHYRQHPASLTITDANTAESAPYFEDRLIAETYMAQEDLSPSELRDFVNWHSLITTYQVMQAVSQLGIYRAYVYGIRGWRYDKTWPLFFIRTFFNHMILKLKK